MREKKAVVGFGVQNIGPIHKTNKLVKRVRQKCPYPPSSHRNAHTARNRHHTTIEPVYYLVLGGSRW